MRRKAFATWGASLLVISAAGSDAENIRDPVLDESFNQKGFVTCNIDPEGERNSSISYAMGIDSRGRIVVAGGAAARRTHGDAVIWRYLHDGRLDTSFGNSGFVTHNSAAGGNGDDSINGMTIDGNGKIVVVGSSQSIADMDMAIWRFNEDGSLDTTFNGTGIVTSHSAAGGNDDDFAGAIVLDESGRLVITGWSKGGKGDFDMTVWRYNTDGSLDTTFGGDGIVAYHDAAGGGGNDYGNDVVIDSQGRILVTGQSCTGSEYWAFDMAIYRYDRSGNLDHSFDGDGIVTHNSAAGGDRFDMGNALALDRNGRILVTGYSFNGGLYEMVIWRYHQDGTLDKSFDGDGIVTHANAAGGGHYNFSTDIIVDSSENVLIAGHSKRPGVPGEPHNSDWDMALLRFEEGGSVDKSFGRNGVVTHHNAAGGYKDDMAFQLAIDSNGAIVVAGRSYNGHALDGAVWRYRRPLDSR